MPVLIKELHVKINVDQGEKTNASLTGSLQDKELIVSECVEQVMAIMSNLKER